MGKIIEKTLNRFDLGMTSDPREENTRYAQLVKGFDAHTYPHKLVPFRDSEAADTIPDTRRAVNFLFANARLYALGVVSGTARAAVNYKDNSQIGGTGWTAPSNNESSAGTRDEEFFIHYKNYIYGARAGTNFWRHGDITGSPTWSDSWQSVSYTTMAQGFVHPKDDILYIPYDNKVASWNNSSFNATALTLPTYLAISSICDWGNYLAIACKPTSGNGKSIVYLWDRDSSLTTLSESIDWGEGNIQVLENLDGYLVGVSFVAATYSFDARIVLRAWNSGFTWYKELVSEAAFTAGDLPLSKQKANNSLYFLLTITLDGTKHQGLWKVDRSNSEEQFSIVFDRAPNNDTALSSGVIFVVYKERRIP